MGEVMDGVVIVHCWKGRIQMLMELQMELKVGGIGWRRCCQVELVSKVTICFDAVVISSTLFN